MTDGIDPRKVAYERLIEVEMQHPNALMAIARLHSWCRQTGVMGMTLWKIILFFGVIFGAWIATKQWIIDLAKGSAR